MSTLTAEPPRYQSSGVSDEVTREEIVQTERILNLIELNNAALGNAAKWLLVWDSIRELSNRYARSTAETHKIVGHSFENLLIDAARVGNKIISLVADLLIAPQQFVLFTGCDIASFRACIALLHDKRTQWFDDSVSPERVEQIWKGLPHEPVQSLP